MNELTRGCTLQKGKYKIVKTLGRGSFGITYLATTKVALSGGLGKMDVTVDVAIKEFFMDEFNSRSRDGSRVDGTNASVVKNYRKKFYREAENLSKLRHPNIVKVLEVFDENNTTYYAMEYVSGESLDDYIKSKGRISEGEVLSQLIEIGNALQYMHDNKMLHLDLKPKNIMRNMDGHLLLIDFGLSKQYNQNGEPESSTTLGLGTPGYSPIEQANYKQDGTFPATLDIYALGATVYKMLTGTTPPHASDILSDGFPDDLFAKLSISERTTNIIKKAMNPMKKQRFQTVTELLESCTGSKLKTESDTSIVPKVIRELINNMIQVSGGTYLMGNPNTNSSHDERPVHQVGLKSFAIGKYQVTQAEWQAVMGENPSFFIGDRRPVENVSWDDCQQFIAKLNSLTGKKFRLPTEAEWEFAARGGLNGNGGLYAGSNAIDDVAVYERNTINLAKSSYYGTADVGTKMPNELGIYDMSGNVAEWCYDWRERYSNEYVESPIGSDSGSFCVHRGGGWNSISSHCTVFARGYDLPSHKFSNTGLRLVIGPEVKEKSRIGNKVSVKNTLQHNIKEDNKEEDNVEVLDVDVKSDGQKLTMPDTIHITVDYGTKGYGFTFDILSDHLHTVVTASPSKKYGKGTVVEDEYFIDYKSFCKRFDDLGFLKIEHWEKSINGTLTGIETTAFIQYGWNERHFDYSRIETSYGNGPLIQSLQKLLADEDVLQRVIKIVVKNNNIIDNKDRTIWQS